MKNNEGRCVFCGAPLSNPLNNNNAEPVVYGVEGVEARCCSDCNNSIVIPFRMSNVIVKDDIIKHAFQTAARYQYVKDTNTLKLAILEDAKYRAADLLSDIPVNGEDYYEVEDWLKDCIAGKNPALPDFQAIFVKSYVCDYIDDFLCQAASELDVDDYEPGDEDIENVFNEVYECNPAVNNLFDLSVEDIYDVCYDYIEIIKLRRKGFKEEE